MTNQEKSAEFLEAITLDAQNRYNKMKQEIDEYIDSELEKARVLAHESVKSFKKTELDRLNEQNNASFSELEALETKKLIDRRTQITNDVFAEASAKIEAFTKSDKYLDFLKSSIAKIKSEIGENITVFLKDNDKKYEAELKPLCSSIKYDNSIVLGGCRAENADTNLIADDTLGVRLDEAKKNFYINSGLSITL